MREFYETPQGSGPMRGAGYTEAHTAGSWTSRYCSLIKETDKSEYSIG